MARTTRQHAEYLVRLIQERFADACARGDLTITIQESEVLPGVPYHSIAVTHHGDGLLFDLTALDGGSGALSIVAQEMIERLLRIPSSESTIPVATQDEDAGHIDAIVSDDLTDEGAPASLDTAVEETPETTHRSSKAERRSRRKDAVPATTDDA